MKKRDSFTNRLGFILACVGSAVGMGNLWMFQGSPFTAAVPF